MSTVKATNFQNASSAAPNMVTDASGNVSFGGTAAMSSSFLRNRIINGDMRVDQRNAGAAVTASTGTYTLDRWKAYDLSDAVFTVQQDSSAPTGFVNSAKVTITTADASIGAAQYNYFAQFIEGLNVSDLAWGTASAQSVTLSFWVRSSVTGTFGGAFANSAYNRSYPFTYSISVANTWEQKTVTVAGDTSGTWLTTNGIGIEVYFDLGTGTDNTGTSGAWVGAGNIGADSTVQLATTLSATWYITGVQLEVGTVATPFERQLYSNQLAQCQRYYYRATAAGSSRVIGNGFVTSTTIADFTTPFPVTMRDEPSALDQTGTASNYTVLTGGGGVTCSAVPTYLTSTQWGAQFRFTVASGLTTGQSVIGRIAVTGGYLGWSAEL